MKVTDNFFIGRLFDWNEAVRAPAIARANRILARMRSPFTLKPRENPFRDMTNIEMRLSLWHLAAQPLAYGVPGDLVDFGCYEGQSAVLFAHVTEQHGPDRQVHVYDHFGMPLGSQARDVEGRLREIFRAAGCRLPVIHRGDFKTTVPAELPERIAFAHVDCGFGGDPEAHARTVAHLLTHLYDRMPKGAVCAIMDYDDPAASLARSHNPGAGTAARAVLADKPETVCALWAGNGGLGYFRRV